MQLEHTFTVPAAVEDVWAALLEPERVAPCMPGAVLTEVDGNTFGGKVKVKLGPVSLQYKGTGEYIETDEATHTVVIKASGKDARGNGTAAATVTLRLTGDGNRTEGTATTDLTITGKPAQFGRGMITDVGGKILEQFASCLSDKLAAPDSPAEVAPLPPATTAAPEAKPGRVLPTEEAEPLDLTQYASGAVAKRAVPAAAAVIVAVLVFLLVRRRRGCPGGD
ncbi:SRPBCC family protein [Tomitella biformata]|uniref:SRPBCC family protein n=1 Tax=Tomitella biformata TaxID=630403 RepID=UPI000467B5DA|nr:SRPBCC family protein [Tomitella biformata]